MTLRRSQPVPFSPKGVSDTLDGTNVFPGAMASLQNLIPDPTTKNLWQCRPAAIELTDFASFSNPNFISALIVIGTRAYGLIASDLNAGHDEPFAYDLATSTFIAISGVTALNTPISPEATGEWTPPTMSLVGTKLVVTHPGFTGSGGYYFGWFDIADPNNLTWDAGNTATNGLPAVPVAVKQFNGRAYFAVNPPTGQPALYFSDALVPTTITNANQILTFGDNVKLTAIGALPLSNQLGGMVQSLIVFKGASNMFQVTGDAASTTAPLTLNALNVATGTLAPNSITPTPKGLAFVAPDGLRLIDFNGMVSDPIGDAGSGITTPFIYAVAPSRIAAACNAKVFRVSVQNGFAAGSPVEEYWYDIPRACWSGPHTFPAALIQPYNGTFIMQAAHGAARVGIEHKLYQSDAAQSSTSTYVENGNQMSFLWKTAMLPDQQQMAENAMIETTLNIAYAAGSVFSIAAGDENGALFDTVILTAPAATTVWGGFTWGAALWQGASNALSPRQIDWTVPIVFRRVYISVTGNCAQGIRFGDMFMRYEILGYLQQ